jgi:hypothetical protein
MVDLIDNTPHGIPASMTEVATPGRTVKRRAAHVPAYFDRPQTSNSPTEAINGQLEHLPGIALAFRTLSHHLARRLPETGGFRPPLHPALRRAGYRRRQITGGPPLIARAR